MSRRHHPAVSGGGSGSGGVMAFLSSASGSKSSSSGQSGKSSRSSSSSSNSGGKGSGSSSRSGFFSSSRSSGSSSSGNINTTSSSGSKGSLEEAAAHEYYGGLLEMDENDNSFPWGLIHHNELATMLNSGLGKTMVIDSRSFLEYNTSNIQQSVNVCCSKLVKRRLQQDKVHVVDLLNQTCNVVADSSCDVIVYDQCTEDPSLLTADNFVHVLLRKLSTTFNSVAFLKGGFLTFQASHSNLVENKSSRYQCSTLTSLSQPCMPVSNVGPTRILSFLYLGSQQDSMAHDVAQVNGITYILNVSKTCPRPPFILEGHFYRIPVNDNYCEKLMPYFPEAFQFLDKVREANGCVLVHCLGGVSRSATLAIAYIMKHMKMSSDEAYRYVKDKRPTISPNFNFLGQLLEYEKIVRREEAAEAARKKTLKACRSPDGDGFTLDDVGRASPSVMDLHTSSPSSPGPRTANKTFSPPSDLLPSGNNTAIQLSTSGMGCPFPGPESVTPSSHTFQHHHQQQQQSSLSNSSPLTTRLNQGDTTPSSQSQHRSNYICGQRPELCPFPGPSYANPAYTHNPTTPKMSIDPLSQKADSYLPASAREIDSPNPRPGEKTGSVPSTPSNAATVSVCPITGFPSPGATGSSNPKPLGFSSPSLPQDPIPNQSVLDISKATTTYQSETIEVSHVANFPSSSSEPPLVKMDQSKAKPGFFSSVFSGFRRRSRPPTLSLGSPVAHNKSSFSTLGEKILGPQLTPVSEASENCDINSSENISEEMHFTTCNMQKTNTSFMSKSVSSECFASSYQETKVLSSPSPTSSQNFIPFTSLPSQNELPKSSSSSKTPPRTRSAKLNPRNFFLSLSSPTTDLHMSSSMPCLSSFSPASSPMSGRQLLPSPGDSNNKRKSGVQYHQFNTPDKLARTDDHLSSASCSKSGQGPSPTSGKVRQRPSIKKPTFLTLSSPTTAMARLNFSSPSNPSKDFQSSLLAAEESHQSKTSLNSNKVYSQGSSVGSCGQKDLLMGKSTDHSSLTESNLSLFTSLSSTSSSSGAMSRSSISCSSSSGSAALDLSSSSVSSSYLCDGGGRAASSASSSSRSSSVLSSSTSSSSTTHYQSLSRFPTTSLDKLSFTPCSVRDIVQDLKDRDSSICKSEDQCSSSFLTDSHASSSALDSPMSISSGSSNPSSTLSPVEAGAAPSFPSSATPQRSDSIDDEPSLGLHDPMEQHVDDSITDSGIHSVSQPTTLLTSPLDDSSAAVTPDSMLSPSSTLPQSSISPVIPSLTSPCDSMCSSNEPLSPMSLDDSILLNSPICSPSYGGQVLLSQQNLTTMTTSVTQTSLCSSTIVSSSLTALSPISSTSSMAVSSSSSLTLPSCSAAVTPKVVLRKDKNRRVLDRPNSIAFSSYPACDLISKSSDNSGGNSAKPRHHDDTSSAISLGHARRARSSLSPDIPYHRGRTSWACYSEREVYRQITAAMESAMLQTQAYLPRQSPSVGRISHHSGGSRKARSLDNIIDNGEEDHGLFVNGRGTTTIENSGSSKVQNDSVGASHYRGKYMQEKAMLFEPYHCGMQGGSEPYHSSSSLSSNGSHGSIHSSLEIIQLPR